MFIKPPNFIFKASCNRHDFKYWRGGSRKDRLRADFGFRLEMDQDVFDAGCLRMHRIWAQTYYGFVRNLGWMFFNWRPKKGKRTLWDLVERMLEEGIYHNVADAKMDLALMPLN